MAKQASLLSFFTKEKSKPSKSQSVVSSKQKALIINGKEFRSYDLVWAKLEGYPWWPALIYEHPREKKIVCRKCVHVQFFDDPPTRGWVKYSFVKNYESPSDLGIPTYKDPLWEEAKKSADAVINIPHAERASLIAEILTSDEEEMESADESKENVDINSDHGKKRILKEENGKDTEPKIKKRRIVLLSSESEDEYKPDTHEESDDDSSSLSGVSEQNISDLETEPEMVPSEPETESEAGTPVKVTPKRKALSNMNESNKKIILMSPAPKMNGVGNTESLTTSTSSMQTLNKLPQSSPKVNGFNCTKTTVVSITTKSKLASFAARETLSKDSSTSENGDYPYSKLSWLKGENVQDKEKRSPSDPEFNPRTLHVPEEFLKKQTPAMRQWWILKAQHFDTVLFFKMGKFYELFHMDAVLSVEQLGLLMMKGENAHTGFPEISYGRYSSLLIERGYKIARVEQTETPEMMEKRLKKTTHPTKFDKVVNRLICQVSSLGTRVPSVMDGNFGRESNTTYLLAITERTIEGPGENRDFGVAFMNATIGKFHIGQFSDDRHLSRLRTLLAHYPPAQILVEKGRLSSSTMQMVESAVPSGLLEILNTEKEFWSSSKTFSFLAESDNFKQGGPIKWPETLKQMMNEGDTLGLTASSEYDLGISSLGAIIWYLILCKLEQDLLTRRMFVIYTPPDYDIQNNSTNKEFFNKHMIMDGSTLSNLEVFENSTNESCEGTLFETLNHCQTSFGKRLLQSWICSPLCDEDSINSRLDAIEDLKDRQDIVSTIKPLMKELPDLEKLLAKIHSQGLKRHEDHPDNKAILFEIKTFSQRKVIDFLSTINGFKATVTIMDWFKEARSSLKSKLLKNCVTLKNEGGHFPPLKEHLQFFDGSFDHNLAKQEGKIIPSEGVDAEYDRACSDINVIKNKLNEYLKQQGTFFGSKVTYFGSEKRRFQIEVNDNAAKKADTSYELVTQRKGFKRYWTKTTKSLLQDIMVAEDQKEAALRDIARRIFQQFDDHINEWNGALECMSVLDVLLSLTQYSLQIESVRPIVITPTSETEPFIEILDGRHPCAIKIFSGGDYIPNNVVIGCDNDPDSHKRLVLVTGPNMGGKSTLMRQTALICLMAQMGSYVPASKCSLTAIDRIFTRLGAQDKIFQGESTFYVELAETASIMKHATSHSLVIVDELGRGTATYDGTAIAFAVVDALTKIKCRTLFSTHYHSLVDDFKSRSEISQGHMACMVENDDVDDPSQETITFLYKFALGSCPKSYGFNAARLASLPERVIECAREKAKQLETDNLRKKYFILLFRENSGEDISSCRDVIKSIQRE